MLGLIEEIGESLASLLKVFSGHLSLFGPAVTFYLGAATGMLAAVGLLVVL